MLRSFPLIFMILCSTFLSISQEKLSFELKETLSNPSKKITNEPVPLVIQGNPSTVKATVEKLGGTVQYSIGDFVSINLPLTAVKELAESETIQSVNGMLEGQNLNDSVRYYNNVNPVHEGLSGLDRPYRGKGVVVGIIDSGIDYRHDDFKDDFGNNRIAYIWDQRERGAAPDGFGYGYECDPESIANGTCPSTDYISSGGHGTHVAGTAAANDSKNGGLHSGMAPEATIIAVVYNGGNFGTSVLDAAKYIYDKANELGMPCVINLSAGSYSGSHDGTDPYTQALDELINEQPGRAFVNAAGNAGDKKIHLGYEVTEEPSFTWFKYRGNSLKDVAFNVFANPEDLENVYYSFQADKNAGFGKAGATKLLNVLEDYNYPTANLSARKDTVRDDAGTIIGIVTTTLKEENGTLGLYVDINKTTSAFRWRFTTSGSGKIDVYSSAKHTRTSDIIDVVPNENIFPEIANYKFPDHDQNIVGFFNASDQVISVGNYTSKSGWTNINGTYINKNLEVGSLYFSSSHGPTRDGRMKPDLASTGSVVVSTGKKELIETWMAQRKFNRINVDGFHFRNMGTSMSAPAVTGGIALLLEKYPNLTNEEIRNSVLQNTKTDNFTGTTPNEKWGHGKFDALAMITNPYIVGCTDENAENYNPDATVDSGECTISGCTDPTSDNYNPLATIDDGSCEIVGCMDPNSLNYNPQANVDDGSCFTPSRGEDFVLEFYPNPMVTTGTIRYAFDTDRTDKLEIQILNELGQVMMTRQISGSSGTLSFNRGSSSLASGMYYVRLISDGMTLKVKKWVIQ